MKKNLLAFLLLLTLILPSAALAQVAAVKITPAERKAAEAITQEQLRSYLYFIASDEMEGRNTPSRGLDLTAKFIAMNLSRWGVKPAGDNGTYFQKMNLRRDSIDRANAFMEVGAQRFPYGEEFFKMRGSTNGTLSAPLVFAGNGWLVKSKNIDAYSNVDVRGKIAVIQLQGAPTDPSLNNLPKGVTRADLKPEAKGTEWADPVSYAQQKGATGVIIVASPELQGFWGQVRQFLSSGGATRVEGIHEEPKTSATVIPVFLVSQTIGGVLYEGEKTSPLVSTETVSSFEMNTAKRFGVSVESKGDTQTTQNVVGIIEGSDPVLKNEYVAVGAHYDHVGMNPNVPGDDKIFNGADDDGSGTTAVLAIAETLAKMPKKPKRSILLVWHAGEEKGLWGSEYFVKYPTVDLKNVIAQLNIDMIGRSKKAGYQAPCDVNLKPGQKPCNGELTGENEVYVIGSEMMSSDLGGITKGVNDSFMKMTYNYKYDDPKDENQFFFRSDHYHYATKGIPIAFWFSGTHEDYHGVGDHADKIDYAKMEKITRTIFLTLWELAEMKTRPKVDKQLPTELTR